MNGDASPPVQKIKIAVNSVDNRYIAIETIEVNFLGSQIYDTRHNSDVIIANMAVGRLIAKPLLKIGVSGSVAQK